MVIDGLIIALIVGVSCLLLSALISAFIQHKTRDRDFNKFIFTTLEFMISMMVIITFIAIGAYVALTMVL